MPGVSTAGQPALANGAPVRVAFHIRTVSAPGMIVFRGSMAGLCTPLPTLRHALAGVCARSGPVRVATLHVRDFHPLLLAGLPAHSETCTLPEVRQRHSLKELGPPSSWLLHFAYFFARMADGYLATAANAVDHPVERRVLRLIGSFGSIRFCSEALIGARLAPPPPSASGSACWLSSSTEVRPDFASHPAASSGYVRLW